MRISRSEQRLAREQQRRRRRSSINRLTTTLKANKAASHQHHQQNHYKKSLSIFYFKNCSKMFKPIVGGPYTQYRTKKKPQTRFQQTTSPIKIHHHQHQTMSINFRPQQFDNNNKRTVVYHQQLSHNHQNRINHVNTHINGLSISKDFQKIAPPQQQQQQNQTQITFQPMTSNSFLSFSNVKEPSRSQPQPQQQHHHRPPYHQQFSGGAQSRYKFIKNSVVGNPTTAVFPHQLNTNNTSNNCSSISNKKSKLLSAPYNTTQYIMYDYSKRKTSFESEKEQFEHDWDMQLAMSTSLPVGEQAVVMMEPGSGGGVCGEEQEFLFGENEKGVRVFRRSETDVGDEGGGGDGGEQTIERLSSSI